MKKVLSLVLAVAMIATLFVVALPTTAAAAAAAKDPTIAVSKSKCIGTLKLKYMSFGGTDYAADKNCAGNNLGSLALTTSGYATSDGAVDLQLTWINPAGTLYTPFCEKNVTDSSATYNCFIQFSLGEGTTVAPTKIKSIMLAVPALSSAVALCAPDGFTIYAGTAAWQNTTNNDATIINANKANYKFVMTVSDLISGGKYVESADKSYRYYECDLPEEIEASYLLFLMNKSTDMKTVTEAKAAGDAPSGCAFFTEFAAYSESISAAPATGDSTVIFTVLAAVAALGMAVVIRRKVTD